MESFLKDGHPLLGSVPGPLALATLDGTIWAAGGGWGESSLLRFGTEGWHSRSVDTSGLRALLPLGGQAVVVAGEYGYLAIVDGPKDVRRVATGHDGCLYALTLVGELIWVTGDDGFVATLDPRAGELHAQPRFTGEAVVQAVAAPGGELVFVAGRQLMRRSADGTVNPGFAGRAPLTDAAYAPDGRLAVAGDRGQLFLAEPGGSPVPCGGVPRLDLECLRYDPRRDGFLVGGERGFTGVLGRDGELQALPAAVPPYRLTSIAPWGDGHLYAGWTEQGPPYKFRGALYFDAAGAPAEVYQAPRQDFGPPRERTVGRSGRPVVAVEDAEVIPLDEAKRRMPDVSWPDYYRFNQVRFYDGDVHVADTEALLPAYQPGDYAVAIRGDLIVDGTLNATAGGDGYGSWLLVQGDVWAQSAIFRYAIAASFSGTLEVATVVMCDRGDDGGYIEAKMIRAQVVSYSVYFPRPEAEIDAFCIGDVYGDESFPPARGNEVFVSGVLEDGELEEDTAVEWLCAGRPILRDA
jgi:hypothetical protein